MTEPLIEIIDQLIADVAGLSFGPPVTHVYNPLEYARAPHEEYLRRFATPGKEVVFVGMNPGPWGMAQTGVPFGEVAAVSEWMGICRPVTKPAVEHPKRPVEGFSCRRSEVSGRRLWGWAKARFGSPEAFFRRFFVANYCPLVFMEANGRNRTPDRLPARERAPLFAACDTALRALVTALKPRWVVGVGGFAEARAQAALAGTGIRVGRVLHPSPASPAANRGWAARIEVELAAMGIAVDEPSG